MEVSTPRVRIHREKSFACLRIHCCLTYSYIQRISKKLEIHSQAIADGQARRVWTNCRGKTKYSRELWYCCKISLNLAYQMSPKFAGASGPCMVNPALGM